MLFVVDQNDIFWCKSALKDILYYFAEIYICIIHFCINWLDSWASSTIQSVAPFSLIKVIIWYKTLLYSSKCVLGYKKIKTKSYWLWVYSDHIFSKFFYIFIIWNKKKKEIIQSSYPTTISATPFQENAEVSILCRANPT